jgi:hypothetical protein
MSVWPEQQRDIKADGLRVWGRMCQGAPDARTSRKILDLAREQQDEMDELLDGDRAFPSAEGGEETGYVWLPPRPLR